VPLNIECKLEVWDSPNSAGVIIDAVRCAKLGLDRGLTGTLEAPSSYFMKSPPIQVPDDIARNNVEAFLTGDNSATVKPGPGYTGSDSPSVPKNVHSAAADAAADAEAGAEADATDAAE
jgi:myo-inositol-1-phosphate synthase